MPYSYNLVQEEASDHICNPMAECHNLLQDDTPSRFISLPLPQCYDLFQVITTSFFSHPLPESYNMLKDEATSFIYHALSGLYELLIILIVLYFTRDLRWEKLVK